jgi:hypothetical protein
MATTTHKVELKPDHGADLHFRWQMYFNRFKVEEMDGGKMVSFAYQKDLNSNAAEIVPIFIPIEGLVQLKEGAASYLPGFAGTEDPGESVEVMPQARCFSPLFGNHVRLSRSGKTAEIVIFTMLLTLIIDKMKNVGKKRDEFPIAPVALFHSSIPIHYRLICKLLDGIDA